MAIIKFKNRKNIHSAKQLAHYILTDKGQIKTPLAAPVLLHNLSSADMKTMHCDFVENFKYLPKRKGRAAILHEIISFSELDKDHFTPKVFQDLMQQYLKLRGAEYCIAIGKAHTHKHPHFHMMISPNELRSKKSMRMSIKQMNQLLYDFEMYHKTHYPELSHSLVHTIKTPKKIRNITKENRNTRREKEYQLKLRLQDKKPTQKEIVSEKIATIFRVTNNPVAIAQRIQEAKDIYIYTYRGIMRGVLYKKRKYRFSTLGIDKNKIQELEKIQERLYRLKLLKEAPSRQRRERGC